MSIREQTFNAYEGFLQKFKPKKTTDDCYTPPNIYEAVLGWVAREYFRAEPQRRGEVDYIGDRMVVRPFWPGADFKALEYPRGCVVVDNPPFSILAAIVKFYYANGIDYFLFSPYLTNLGVGAGGYGVNHVIAPCSVLYENGALVDTAFVTNLGDDFIRGAPDLMDAIEAANEINLKKVKRTLPKYVYPDCVLTSAAVGYMCKHHTPFALKRKDCAFIRKLDAQGDNGIFGGRYLLSERAAAERAAAERAAAERAGVHVWHLSPREIALQKLLGKKE